MSLNIDGLVEDCSISSALLMEIYRTHHVGLYSTEIYRYRS